MSQRYILGAGPAGLAAAIVLARRGERVTVYEQRNDVGRRFNGDLQGIENWSSPQDPLDELRQYGLTVNFDANPFYQLTATNGRLSRTGAYDKPSCYLVRRGPEPGTLDVGLKEQALAAGVDIQFNTRKTPDDVDIVATGPNGRETFAVARGIVFNSDHDDLFMLFLNNDVAYKGYGYLLLTQGHGCLCTVLFDRFNDVDAAFGRLRQMAEAVTDVAMEQPRPCSGLGSFSTANVYQRGRTLYVGEAAGIQDLMLGFGIRTAIKSGCLAAEALLTGADYATLAEATFAGRLRATVVGRAMWELAGWRDYWLLVNPWLYRQARGRIGFSLFHRESRWTRLLYPWAQRKLRRRYTKLTL